MCAVETQMMTHFFSQIGILSSLVRKHSSLEKRIAAWFTGERPVLIIGGEPGSGKSLLMGELALRYSELMKRHVSSFAPLRLISYDRVHYLFLRRLAEIHPPHTSTFLPEGETHPEARQCISQIMRDLLLFALRHFPQRAPIALEAPLIEYRGENLLDDFKDWHQQMQVIIMYSPTMWKRVVQEKHHRREMISAQTSAMQRIHHALLQQRGITQHSQQEQERALIESWERWLGQREGMLLPWNPAEDEAGFAHTKAALQARGIHPDPLAPNELQEHTHELIEILLRSLPDPVAFAVEVQAYRPHNAYSSLTLLHTSPAISYVR
jgi:Cdc6-like AAA superfamily ATPase